jgi:hypothetical protein
MPIRFACPSCQRRLVVEDRRAGRVSKCPSCQESITIPSHGSAAPIVGDVGAIPDWIKEHSDSRFANVTDLGIELVPMKRLETSSPVSPPSIAPKTATGKIAPPSPTTTHSEIHCACDQCNTQLYYNARYAGKKAHCPACNSVFTVPESTILPARKPRGGLTYLLYTAVVAVTAVIVLGPVALIAAATGIQIGNVWVALVFLAVAGAGIKYVDNFWTRHETKGNECEPNGDSGFSSVASRETTNATSPQSPKASEKPTDQVPRREEGSSIPDSLISSFGRSQAVLAQHSRSACGWLRAHPLAFALLWIATGAVSMLVAVVAWQSLFTGHQLLGIPIGHQEQSVFRSERGRFSILFHSKPEETSKDADTPFGKQTLHLFTCSDQGSFQVVGYIDYPVEVRKNKTADEVFDNARFGVNLFLNGIVFDEKRIMIGNDKHPGRELFIKSPTDDHVIRYRMYLVGNRFYQVVVGGSQQYATGMSANEFLDSFKIKE